MSGWVKLHRQYLESRYGRNMEVTALFHALLVMANFNRSFCPDGTEILPGQLMTSQIKLADHFNCSRGKIKRLLDILESDNQIKVNANRYHSLITIINWEKYQGSSLDVIELSRFDTPNDTSRRTTEHTPDDTHNKNAKNAKNVKNSTSNQVFPFFELIKDHPDTGLQAWIQAGELGPQQKMLETYDHEYLTEVIESAYYWQKENNKKRKAGRYIADWIKRDSNSILKGNLTPYQARLKNFFEDAGLTHLAVEKEA